MLRRRKPKKGQLLRLRGGLHPLPPLPSREFVANHGYLYTMLGAYPAISTKGNMYRVQSVASGAIVHMFDYELEAAKGSKEEVELAAEGSTTGEEK